MNVYERLSTIITNFAAERKKERKNLLYRGKKAVATLKAIVK